jgi:AcrR family transcriptional regulator
VTDQQQSVLWERVAPTGRTSGDLIAEIAAAAVAIADREGLAALSVKRVASKVGLPASKLGTYLTTKDDLFDLIFDAFYAGIEGSERGDETWREDLRQLATATKAAIDLHPWVLELMGARPPYGPNGLRYSERALAALDGLDLPAAELTSAVNTVLAYVCGSVRRSGSQSGDAATARYLLAAVESDRYPRLAQVFRDSGELTADESFRAGLECVLDGLTALVATEAAAIGLAQR